MVPILSKGLKPQAGRSRSDTGSAYLKADVITKYRKFKTALETLRQKILPVRAVDQASNQSSVILFAGACTHILRPCRLFLSSLPPSSPPI